MQNDNVTLWNGDINNNDGDKTWEINEQAGYNSSKSIYINNADYAANGESDDLILPSIDFTSSTLINLSFRLFSNSLSIE